MRSFIFFISALFCFSAEAQSQSKSYYVKGDSLLILKGQVLDDTDVHNSRFVRVAENSQVMWYNPTEVSEFGTNNGKVFKSEWVGYDINEQLFLERLINGDVKLLQLHVTNFKGLYLKSNDSLFHLTKENFKQRLNSLLQNCDLSTERIKNSRLTIGSLKRLLTIHKDCSLERPRNLTFGIYTGFLVTQERIQQGEFLFKPNGFGFQAGGWVELRPLTSMLIPRLGMEVFHNKFSSEPIAGGADLEGEQISRTINQKMSYFAFPISLRLNPVKGLYAQIGMSPGVLIGEKLEYSQFSSGSENSTPVRGFVYPSGYFGQFVGVGYIGKFAPGHYWTVDVVLNKSNISRDRFIVSSRAIEFTFGITL